MSRGMLILFNSHFCHYFVNTACINVCVKLKTLLSFIHILLDLHYGKL